MKNFSDIDENPKGMIADRARFERTAPLGDVVVKAFGDGRSISGCPVELPRGIDQVRPSSSSRWFKRGVDIVGSLLLLPILLPVMAIVAVLLKVRQGGPVLYRAHRIRAPGRSFIQYKFRTMTATTLDSGGTGAHKHWRITRMGHWLRKSRLDELPQLFNIVRGDMSFVGPRPPLQEYVEAFPDLYAQILINRPGVTGLATLIYHRHEDWIMAKSFSAETAHSAMYGRCLPTKLRIELIYLARRSFWLDMWVIGQTLRVVFAQDPTKRRVRPPFSKKRSDT